MQVDLMIRHSTLASFDFFDFCDKGAKKSLFILGLFVVDEAAARHITNKRIKRPNLR